MGHRITLGDKEMSSMVERRNQERKKMGEGRAIGGGDALPFCDANDTIPCVHALILLQDMRPIPGTLPTHPEALIDEIKGTIRKFKETKRIHDMKLDPIT